MNVAEVFNFDRLGYLYLRSVIEPSLLAPLVSAVDKLQPYFEVVSRDRNLRPGKHGVPYVLDEDTAVSVFRYENPGLNIVVDDFFSAAEEFLPIINHPTIMHYVDEMVLGPVALSSAELRYRYQHSRTMAHMGGPIDVRNAYRYVGKAIKNSSGGGQVKRAIDLANLRVLIALHDIDPDNGPLCVSPATHKANLWSPYGADPEQDPTMHALPMKAGDAIVFTEALRHAGMPNRLERVRKTIHLCYNPDWVGSQSPAHFNRPMRFRKETWDVMSDAQRALFPDAQILGA